MASPVFRLTYFPFHGRGLPIRLAATLNGLKWEDRWIKRDKFIQDKVFSDYSGYSPRWTGLPEVVLYRDLAPSITVGQSIGLLRYIARLTTPESKHTLYPIDDTLDCLLIDEILYADEDMIGIVKDVFIEQDETKKAKMTKELTDDPKKLPLWFQRFEDRLKENKLRGHKNGFFVGNDMTIADLQFFGIVSMLHPETKHLHPILSSWNEFRFDFFKNYPKAYEHTLRMADHETIKTFMESFNAEAAQFMLNETKQEMVIQRPTPTPQKEKSQKKRKKTK